MKIMKPKREIVKMGITLPKELYDELENAYEKTSIPKSNIIKIILTRHLKNFMEGGNN